MHTCEILYERFFSFFERIGFRNTGWAIEKVVHFICMWNEMWAVHIFDCCCWLWCCLIKQNAVRVKIPHMMQTLLSDKVTQFQINKMMNHFWYMEIREIVRGSREKTMFTGNLSKKTFDLNERLTNCSNKWSGRVFSRPFFVAVGSADETQMMQSYQILMENQFQKSNTQTHRMQNGQLFCVANRFC